jgi:hypothetical protein
MAAIEDGRTNVTTAGTRVQLTTNSSVPGEVTIIALTENTSQVYVGDISVVALTGATTRGVPLYPGDSVTFYKTKLSDLYLDSRVNGEGVTYIYGASNA